MSANTNGIIDNKVIKLNMNYNGINKINDTNNNELIEFIKLNNNIILEYLQKYIKKIK